MQKRFVLALPLLAALAVPALAAHATTRLDAIAAGVAARQSAVGLTGAQVKALKSAAKLLAKTTKTEAADVAAASKAAKLLDKAFPGDAEFGAALDTAIGGFQGDVQGNFASLDSLLSALPDGKKKSAATKSRDKASAFLDAFLAAAARAEKLADLGKSQTSVDKATKQAVGGGDWVVASVDGTGFASSTAFGTVIFDENSGGYSASLAGVFGPIFRQHQQVTVAALPVTIPATFALDDPAEGQFDDCAGGLGVCTEWKTFGAALGTGSLTFTKFDVPTKLMEGFFSLTATKDGGASTKTVTNGRFHVHWH